MVYKTVITTKARKQLENLPAKQQNLVKLWLKNNLLKCANPKGIFGCTKIENRENLYRYRAGSYRIICRILKEELIIEVIRIGHRQGVYGNLPKQN